MLSLEVYKLKWCQANLYSFLIFVILRFMFRNCCIKIQFIVLVSKLLSFSFLCGIFNLKYLYFLLNQLKLHELPFC